MSDRYPGGLIRKTPPTIVGPVDGEGGSAPGIWTLEQASYYQGTGEWPKPVLPRELYAWGQNQFGNLGVNSIVNVSSPTQVSGGGSWASITSGDQATASIKSDGTLWTWGRNEYGELALGLPGNSNTNRSSPVQVGALTTWANVTFGRNHVLAVKDDGTLWACGYNAEGQVGDNTRARRSSLTQIGAGTTWAKTAAANLSSFATKTDGTLWAWGSSSTGLLGQNNTVYRSSPVQVGALTTWLEISGGGYNLLAIKTDGTLWAMGNETGTGTTINFSSPVQVGALTTWNKIYAGRNAMFAIKTDGTLWAWGAGNTYGELGQNNTITYSSPVQVGSDTNWKNIAGSLSTFGTKTDGTLWFWGYPYVGMNGENGPAINRSSPIQIGSETSWDQVNIGKNNLNAAFATAKG